MAQKKQKMHLATITILVKDRRSKSSGVNRILTKHGHVIMARLGVNVERRCMSNCLAMIAVALEGAEKEIRLVAAELNKLEGISAKMCIFS